MRREFWFCFVGEVCLKGFFFGFYSERTGVVEFGSVGRYESVVVFLVV